jgi:hypothetical protein
MKNWNTTDLDADDILSAYLDCVPVNVRVDQAIEAHRIAFNTSQDEPEARQLTSFALHAVVLARTPEVADYRAQLDYLEALPETAWPSSPEHSAAECREATLAAIRQQIAWVSACA